MDIHPDVIQSISELGSKSYIFILTKSVHSQICFNYLQKFYLNEKLNLHTIFNEKVPNQCKEETNSKLPSNILSFYKASS